MTATSRPEDHRRWPEIRSYGAALALASALLLAGCGGGGGGSSGEPNTPRAPGTGVQAPNSLTTADITTILTQAGNEAAARGSSGSIAVVDRVGNVLAVMVVGAGGTTETISSTPRVVPQPTGLEGAVVPSTLASISKAITGAYLSSNGNAFSSRTASQIVQEHFPPLVPNLPGGPLFGVQFSQLPCGDFVTNAITGSLPTGAAGPGPHRSPLGLSADPGGFPLYKGATLVGGIGVSMDRIYGLDRDLTDIDTNVDEIIAIAGTTGYDAPANIRAEQITVAGFSLRYSDANTTNLLRPVTSTGALPGTLVSVAGFTGPSGGGGIPGIRPGTEFLTAASGYITDPNGDYPAAPFTPVILVDNTGGARFRPTAGTSAPAQAPTAPLTADEVRNLITQALGVAFQGRAQIRRPLNSFIQVTVSVVDLNGNILGMARTPDAPVFGTDVSLQKARTAMFFSRTDAQVTAAGDRPASLSNYFTATATFLGIPTFPAPATQLSPGGGGIAFGEQSIGNISRPFYPDGIDSGPNGPLSRPFSQWSPFSTGFQLDAVSADVLATLGPEQASPFCGARAGFPASGAPIAGRPDQTRFANGPQIFSGGVPIYRGNNIVGAIGVSGDGITQDNMVSFLGLGRATGTINNAPTAVRADKLNPLGQGFLTYAQCPQSPFLDSSADNVCDGL